MPTVVAPPCTIRAAAWPGDGEWVRGLIGEYVARLGVDLSFQHVAEELASLPGAYAPPRGALLVATIADDIAGMVAHRPLGKDACEMKRLYVRPAFRGREIGRALGGAIVAEARRAGYGRMLLDTLESMKAARGLYAELGFRPVAAYYVNPLPGAAYLGLDL